MNVLLIYPEFPDTFWSFSHALRFIGKKTAFPPLGLLTVAALLPATWSLRLVDVNVDDLTDHDLAWADMAFLSAMVVLEKTELPGEEQFGVELLKRPLETPVKRIAANAGFEGAVVLAHVMEGYS